jgi:hypothetical protein
MTLTAPRRVEIAARVIVGLAAGGATCEQPMKHDN